MRLQWQRCLLFLLLAALCFLSNGLAGSLRLELAVDSVAPGETGPTIIVTLQNRCTCSVSVYVPNGKPDTSDFLLTVRELSGRPVPLTETEYAIRMSDPDRLMSGGGYFRMLRPTGKLQYRGSLGELYQL